MNALIDVLTRIGLPIPAIPILPAAGGHNV